MSAAVKITMIGAGSAQFSAGIVRDLCVNPGLHGSHVVLMDIDERRLALVRRLAERLSGELRAGLTFSQTTDRAEALRCADFVINTAQVGGRDWSEAQRSMAEKHGYYRGVHLHDYGQAAFFLEVARDVERICPHAWLIQSANPVFEGCTLMTRATNLKVLGLCHGHYGYREIAQVLGLDPARVSARMPGFNHWIWLTEFRCDGQDAYPLIDRWIDEQSECYWAETDTKRAFWDNQMSRAAVHQYRLFGCFPIGDTSRMVESTKMTGWWYNQSLADKQRWFGALGGFDSELGWQQYLDAMNKNVQKIEQAASDEHRPVSETFQPVQSDEQIVPIIDSLVNDHQRIYQVNIPNRGQILPGFPEDLVVECQGLVDAGGIQGISVPWLPEKLMAGAMIPRWQQAELMVTALLRCDWDLLLLDLLNDHRTRSIQQAEGLLTEWLNDPRNDRVRQIFQK